MTNKEAAEWLRTIKEKYIHGGDDEMDARRKEAINMGMTALSQAQPCHCIYYQHDIPTCRHTEDICTDAISRQAVIDAFCLSEKTRKYGGDHSGYNTMMLYEIQDVIEDLPSVSTEKTGRCKDCKHFVYDEFAIVNGIPIIVAHEICSKWGNGCRTKEDGYCHMFEPKMQEVIE